MTNEITGEVEEFAEEPPNGWASVQLLILEVGEVTRPEDCFVRGVKNERDTWKTSI